MRLWNNENTRVFGDRLVNDADRKWRTGATLERKAAMQSLGFEEKINENGATARKQKQLYYTGPAARSPEEERSTQ